MVTISTPALTAAPRLSVTQAQAALSKAQIELSSGRLADIGLGLGDTTGQYLSFNDQQSRLQALTDDNSMTSTRLSSTTSSLDSLSATANTFLSALTEAASSGTIPPTLAMSGSNNLNALIGTLNTSVGAQYIFGGINSSVQPIADYNISPTSATKQAVDSSFSSSFGTSQTSTSAGSIDGSDMQAYLDGPFAAMFSAGSFSSTWSSASDTVMSSRISTAETINSSVSANSEAFRQLAQAYTMIQEFTGSNISPAAGEAVVKAATTLVSTAIAGITQVEAGVGLSQTAVSNANERMATQIDFFKTQSSALVDVDASTLSTQLSGLQTQIQASYEVTSQLQQLSLVNYLK